MKRYIVPVLVLILILASLILPVPNPQHCAICESIPCYAPCLVNLETGEVEEINIYEPHPFKVGELNEYQQGGTFSLLSIAGLKGYSDTSNWEAHISIPTNSNEYKEKYFCKTCRKLIASHAEIGFMLLDLRNPNCVSIISLDSEEVQTVRCYEIETKKRLDEIEIIVRGTLEIVDHLIVDE